MTTRRRRAPARTRGPRRPVQWFDEIVSEVLASSDQQVDELSVDIVDNDKKGMTIVRTIVQLGANLTAAGSGGQLSVGLAMVNDDALAALTLPDADTIDEPGWLYRGVKSVFTSVVNDHSQETRFDLDLKGRRKFTGTDMNFCLILDTGTISGGSINVNGRVRFLVMK